MDVNKIQQDRVSEKIIEKQIQNADKLRQARSADKSSAVKNLEGLPLDSSPVLDHSEKINFSQDVALAKEALQLARQAPDVRRDKVDAIKAAIKNGTYKVDNEKVAEAMLKRHAEDAILESQGS